MKSKKHAFLSLILQHRFDVEVSGWLSATRQGFDVAIICPTPELHNMVSNYLTQKLRHSSDGPRILTQDQCEKDPNPEEMEETSPTCRRTIYLFLGYPPKGTGCVIFEIQSIQALLPSPAFMVSKILEMTGLEAYTDSFDGRRMSQFKQLVEKNGLDDFFDAVIQVAYLVGFRADEKAADHYLERLLTQPYGLEDMGQKAASKDQISLESLFERVIELPEPHDTLKAALAYYVFIRRRATQTEASRILKVSRSTLQSHLQLAERLKVAHYFNSGTSLA